MMLPPLDEFKAKELDDDLIWSRSLYLTHCEHRSRKQHRKRHDRLAKISKATQRLMVLLSDDGSGEPAIRFPLDMQSPTTYLKRILATVEAELSPKFVSPLDIEIEGGKHLADALGIGRLSAFEWLVGERLPQIYEKYYRRRATARGADREPDTDYVRFAEDTLAKLSISRPNNKPHTRESIVRAMSFASRGGRKMGK